MKDLEQNPLHDEDLLSKSQQKRDAETLQALGTRLVNLGKPILDKLPLDDTLKDAIELAQRIRNKHEGYRRQLQFIGKLMRSRDCEDIMQALALHDAKQHQATHHFHQLEQTRDAIINEGDEAIQLFLNEHPAADRQHLRQLARSALREQKNNKPPKAARALFKYLREVSENDA
ncbi:ribosome biogenesis factor YjgA [Candidatus Venteria ishoeyi]|uniref:Dual-action ribosomal maturation protein DarP n=1 Tax=Candidatus Venteria ishoeyi TaxID=1899563 RepID=A0A1H6FG54_9GAMM|nr:ribosome biogenesis factor YjgA [Candidatus Venteria ishoeyi]MDM8545858.1 ribosome biogenesis factor YjgA [Candidatus Venteria ishoeyi]SEH08319.1 Uncharacterised protein [Candidatus Venteria ishoeyi]